MWSARDCVTSPPRQTPGDERQEVEILSEGKPVLDILRDYQRDGKQRWLSETKAPIRSPDGDVIGLVGIARDVTERIQTAEALRSSEEQLKQAQKMEAVGQLAGGIAHDFNNLLSVIDGYGQLVHQALPEGDAKRDDMNEILSASRRASGLTKQLLAFSRRQVVQPKVLNLNDVVADVEKMLRTCHRRKHRSCDEALASSRARQSRRWSGRANHSQPDHQRT